jgi:hypothetical protein
MFMPNNPKTASLGVLCQLLQVEEAQIGQT